MLIIRQIDAAARRNANMRSVFRRFDEKKFPFLSHGCVFEFCVVIQDDYEKVTPR